MHFIILHILSELVISFLPYSSCHRKSGRSNCRWCHTVDLPQYPEQVSEVCLADVSLVVFTRSLLWLEELANLVLALRLERINAHTLALTAGDSNENGEVVLLEEALHRVEGCDSADLCHSVVIAIFIVDVATVQQKVISDAHAFTIYLIIEILMMIVITVDSGLVIGRENGVSPDLAACSTVVRRILGLFTSR